MELHKLGIIQLHVMETDLTSCLHANGGTVEWRSACVCVLMKKSKSSYSVIHQNSAYLDKMKIVISMSDFMCVNLEPEFAQMVVQRVHCRCVPHPHESD